MPKLNYISGAIMKTLQAAIFTGGLLAISSSCFSQATTGRDTTKAMVNRVPMLPGVKITVTDIETGLPIDSAHVFINSTQTGYTDKKGVLVFNDVNGNGSVTVTANRYIDQNKKVQASVHFRLLRSNIGDKKNLVQTGLVSRPEEQYAGSAAVYSGERLRQVNSVNIAEAIAVLDPSFSAVKSNQQGDDPNAAYNLQMRGQRHFPASASIATTSAAGHNGVQISPSDGDFIAIQVTAPNTPLILLDGMQISQQQLSDMDVFMIEKVTLLKDAAATALYGSRGANGVILLQGQKPERGNLNINYTGQLQVSVPDLSSYSLMNASDKLELEKKAGMYVNNDALYQQRLHAVQSGINTDWLRQPTRTGVGSRHQLRLHGGDDALRYGLDVGYNQLEGAMKGSNRKNLNIGGYLAVQVKNLNISNYLSFNQTNAANSPYVTLDKYAALNPYWSNTDSLTGGIPRLLEVYKPNSSDSSVVFYNPAYNSTLSTRNTDAYNRLTDLFQLGLELGKGWQLNGRVMLSSNKDVTDIFLPPGHTAFANYSPDQFFKRGIYNQTSSKFSAWEAGINLQYKLQKGLHYFYGNAGVNALSTSSSSTGVVVNGFTSDQLANLSFGSAYSTSKPATGKIETRLLSSFVNLSYSYNSKYQADASVSVDGSSQFGDNHRYAPYYAGAVSWNAHNEDFISNLGFVDLLRVKASYGVVGSTFFQSYLANTTYNYYTNQNYSANGVNQARGTGLGIFLTGVGNQDLQSPVLNKQNFSVELAILKNRIYIRAEQYKETSKKLVLPLLSPAYTGFSNFNYYENAGSIENKGFELAANFLLINKPTSGIQWSIGANGLHNQNTIKITNAYVDALNKANDNINIDQTQPQAKYTVGQSLTTIWAVPTLGIDPATGHEKFRRKDGSETFVWDAADKIAAGDIAPKWLGSFGTNFTLKQLSVGAWFHYQQGAQVYNQTLADKIENADLIYNVDTRAAANRWTKPGDNALYKQLYLNGKLTDPTYATTRFVEDQHFLQYASFYMRYTWPKFGAGKIPLQNTSIAFTANNNVRQSNVQMERGISYPFASYYSFTISTSFK